MKSLMLLDIALLLCTIVAFAVTAWPSGRSASILFIPYALCVAFATALNFSIRQANRPV